ncbi:MAG: hypothetical protein COU11_02210 [Candidatus Harrisonbacteria bacterium CG10_big_fil_rev_8_21_14_0_10_49_15]|uniref:DUF7282 domain-containing protein n=1 Tax=Candidatus Harrisonbacteria bacterium CG10_big_fil_rev_8_21_14_0_10_49_15 TaxID=1974587 RepID=A0A2H0UKU9_9BACT|nr:MAG: hypothetical protein COU11_02210 [Candidatus Harrisonbacteria bacterium CG10_big_fil_rev_8_21_14_0_10_49_15]
MENKNKTVFWIIVAIVVVALLIFMFTRSGAPTEEVATTAEANSLTIGLQDPSKVAVVVDQVELTQPGFVVIHADSNGAPDDIVASSKLLQPGIHQNVSIVMSTTAGASYHAMLHVDDGNGIFSAATDAPAQDTSGAVVTMRFQVATSPLVDGEVDIKG